MKKISQVLAVAIALLPLSAGAVYLNTNADVQVGAGSDTGVKATTNVDATTGGTKTNGTTDVNVQVGADTNATTHTEITGDPDFDLFAKSVTSAHAEVSAVDLDSDGAVDVAYKHKGWFFGFIPVTVTSHTKVMTAVDGSAKAVVSLPWWSFFVSGVSEARSDAETRLNADATVMANASLQTDAAARVKLVDAMVTSLVQADAAVKASYDLKAGTK